ncbi:MAG: DUF2752 domain-containing protein [Bacteroidota bacterium]
MVFINPYADLSTLCIFERIGIVFCPGEGFGRSVALLMRGELLASLQMHPLGIPGVGIILHRIYRICQRNRKIQTL